MKKLVLILAVFGMITLQSCEYNEVNDPVDNDTISEVIEVTNINFVPQNGFSVLVTLNPPAFTSDMILVYRLDGVLNTGQDLWRLLPQDYFFDDGTQSHSYNFDFTNSDISIFMEGFDLAGLPPQWTQNQVFRIVIVPGFFSNRLVSSDFSDYYQTIELFGLQDKPIQKIKL